MAMYKRFIRPILFLFSPERIHGLTTALLRVGLSLPGIRQLLNGGKSYRRMKKPIRLGEWELYGRVGLPAGFDKKGELLDKFNTFGYAFMEAGTVTPRPQPGNPKPRIFRLPEDQALINRMGFNSPGAEYVEKKMAKKKRHRIPIAINIGKNTATPNDRANEDYLSLFRQFYPLADFFVINISCPNVANLKELQSQESLVEMLNAFQAERDRQKLYRPILLKVGPDQTDESLRQTVQIAVERGVDGFVAINTTQSREGLNTPAEQIESIGNGGLSGAPIFEKALHTVQTIREIAPKGMLIIGVGGINSPQRALQMLQAGASLLECYTGFIYEGPGLIKRINRYLCENQDLIPEW